jgi:hypothetical protein
VSGSNPGGQEIFTSSERTGLFWDRRNLLFNGNRDSFQAVNLHGPDISHSLLPSGKVKNEWS